MRPKVVILILAIGFGLLGAMFVLKEVMAGHSANASGQAPATQANAGSPSAATNDQAVLVNPAGSSNTAASPEQMRAAAIEKELAAIQELLSEANGDNNPTIISALLEKVVHPEPAVRAAALDALKQLNDTNAVPGLQQAVEHIEDPRGKVAVLDAIDYLKLPSVTDNVTPESATNSADRIDRLKGKDSQPNPNFGWGNRNGVNRGRQLSPPNAPSSQSQ
jgi:hypothetical protein